ncbi:MAG TPA: PrsW family intramembrane metalloprotease [Thermoanaerobaculia bacterium]|nr:PrsW family intramembrane metalloprotease [Thermoanaerobaculia bacterium]
MGLLLAAILSFGPALACAATVYWLDRYEKEPKVLLGAVFGWGAVVAALGALVAQTLLGGVMHLVAASQEVVDFAGGSIFAPVTEESLKGFAVLLVFWALHRELDSVLDGIVYAATAALGFAATENVLYLFGQYQESGLSGMFGLFVLRIVLGAWDHAVYTSFIGIALALARLSRSATARWVLPPIGWALAVGAHSLHNTLAALTAKTPATGGLMFLIDWGGWVFFALLVLWCIWREKRMLGRHLAEEVQFGWMTPEQYRTAQSGRARARARVRAAMSGRLQATRRFYDLCGELAHKKNQLARYGEEDGNSVLVERLRRELAQLSVEAAA